MGSGLFDRMERAGVETLAGERPAHASARYRHAYYHQPLCAAPVIKNPGGLVVEMTDGTAEYNNANYRLSLFYDLAKISVIRMAWAQAQELRPHQCTAVALTPGWLRSEIMLDNFGVDETNWQDASATEPHFAISETPR